MLNDAYTCANRKTSTNFTITLRSRRDTEIRASSDENLARVPCRTRSILFLAYPRISMSQVSTSCLSSTYCNKYVLCERLRAANKWPTRNLLVSSVRASSAIQYSQILPFLFSPRYIPPLSHTPLYQNHSQNVYSYLTRESKKTRVGQLDKYSSDPLANTRVKDIGKSVWYNTHTQVYR